MSFGPAVLLTVLAVVVALLAGARWAARARDPRAGSDDDAPPGAAS